MVYKDKKRLKIENIIEKYSIPSKLANYYNNIGEFYEKLKILRDGIVHHGLDIKDIFVFDKGFAISSETNLFKYYSIWNNDEKKPNNYYSLRPLLYHWISNSIDACNEFARVISSVIKFPPSIMSKHNVYIRTPHLKSYNQMKKELNEGTWWNN